MAQENLLKVDINFNDSTQLELVKTAHKRQAYFRSKLKDFIYPLIQPEEILQQHYRFDLLDILVRLLNSDQHIKQNIHSVQHLLTASLEASLDSSGSQRLRQTPVSEEVAEAEQRPNIYLL
ncbi:hypothetical protein QYM36_012415 [Artemia franciscana]|uniref:Uncharacterized protein n=1 Tax=Artemia franciscana TaxID=6661 RepID=A0AA88L7S8_ARTSF|nr:hypothetical protein QYM36_012415 [Artemia franciscana]